jgi:hypothetical protein
MPKFTQAKIREIAILHISQPLKWSREFICNYHNISQAKLDELMKTTAWLEIAPCLERVASERDASDLDVWRSDHMEKISQWQDSRYSMGRMCEKMEMEAFKLLAGYVKGEVDPETAKASSAIFANLSKTIINFDTQARLNIAEALAIDELLDQLHSPKQLDLFTYE